MTEIDPDEDDALNGRVEADEPIEESTLSEAPKASSESELQELRDALNRLRDLDESETAPEETIESPRKFARFEIVKRLGAGAFGNVYLANDPTLGRRVALKLPRTATLLSADQRRRFLDEAKAAARLDHRNVVPVHDAGEEDGVGYIVSSYVDGPTLGEWAESQHEPVPAEAAAEIVRQLAEAVQHAHDNGVLHRDLKPNNVLLEPAPGEATHGRGLEFTPRLVDFGLAKFVDASTQTASGLLLGTPTYMAPEQAGARVRDIDERTDVYSLGTLLYWLLAGRSPFGADSTLELLRRIIEEEPMRPGQKGDRRLPRDIETICLKCLEKEPRRRYGTARELADDLQRFLRHEPIKARQTSLAHRAWKRAKRQPAATGLAIVLTALLLAAPPVTLWYASTLRTALDQAEAEKAAADEQRAHARKSERETQLHLYASDIVLAAQALEANDIAAMDELLLRHVPKGDEPDVRGFEWHYLYAQGHGYDRVLRGHEGDVYFVGFSPDGKRLISGGLDKTARIWDFETGNEIARLTGHGRDVNVALFSPDGETIVTASEDGFVRLWDGNDYRLLHTIDAYPSDIGATVAFSPDGRTIATAGPEAEIRLWNVADAQPRGVISGHEARPNSGRFRTLGLAFSPDGQQLASAGYDNTIRLWDIETKSQRLRIELPARPYNLRFTAEGDRLLSTSSDAAVYVWDPRTGERLETIEDHRSHTRGLAFSPQGEWLATTSNDRAVRVRSWQRSPWKLPATIQRISYSPDGDRIAAATENGIYVRDLASGNVLHLPAERKPAEYSVLNLGLGGTLSYVLTPADKPGEGDVFEPELVTYRLPAPWGRRGVDSRATERRQEQVVPAEPAQRELRPPASLGRPEILRPGPTTSLMISGNGEFLVQVDDSHRVHVWDVRSQTRIETSPEEIHFANESLPRLLAVADDARAIHFQVDDRWVSWWPTSRDNRFAVSLDHRVRDAGIAISPSAGMFVAGFEVVDSAIIISDLHSWVDTCHLTGIDPRGVNQLAVGPSGMVAFASVGRRVERWAFRDFDDWPKQPGWEFANDVVAMTACPARNELAVGADDEIHWRTFDEPYVPAPAAATLRGHEDWVWDVTFRPDGRWLASASRDGTVRLWPVPRDDRLVDGVRPGQPRTTNFLNFSDDGNAMAERGLNSAITVWNLESSEPTGPFKLDFRREMRCEVGSAGRYVALHFHNYVAVLETATDVWSRFDSVDNPGPPRLTPSDPVYLCIPTVDYVHVFDVRTKKEAAKLGPATGFFVVEASAEIVAVAGLTYDVQLWEIGTWRHLHSLTGGHANRVQCMAWSPDGRTLACGGEDGVITLWDPRKGELLRQFQGYRHPVRLLAFSPDGKTLAGVDQSGAGVFHHLATGRDLLSFQVPDQRNLGDDVKIFRSLHFSHRGDRLLFQMGHPSGERHIELWHAPYKAPRGVGGAKIVR